MIYLRWVTLGRKLDSNEVSVWLQVGRGEVHVIIVNAPCGLAVRSL